MLRTIFWLILGCLDMSVAYAVPLYVQRFEAADLSALEVSKAEQQIREHQDIKIRENMAIPPFHKRLDRPAAEETFCQTCHLPWPHSKKPRTRSFLNMHSRYLACETCHFRPKSVVFDYRWLDYETQQPAPEKHRFRTGLKIDNAVPVDGRIKIAPFIAEMPAIALRGSEFAQRINRAWKEADEFAKARLKAKLHQSLEKEGPACHQCHQEGKKSMLDLAALGAEPQQVLAIQRHILPQFFRRYQSDEERLKMIDILR
jgi:hypothetical protein